MIERDDMPEEFKNIFSIEATNNTGKDNLFNSGVFTLIKGRHIEKDDREKIIIHEELAQKNNLELNDKIRLELFDLNNNEIKTEYEYEIIGIFSGKKQEKYTGMTSDFSENMVFIDYESSQVALNKAENNKVVNKLEIFSDSPKDTNMVLNKIKEIKIDWSKFNIEKDDDVYEETLESLNNTFSSGIDFLNLSISCTSNLLISNSFCKSALLIIASFLETILAGNCVKEPISSFINIL